MIGVTTTCSVKRFTTRFASVLSDKFVHKDFTTNSRNSGNPDLNRSSQRPLRRNQSGGIFIPHVRDQKSRHDASLIEGNRFAIFMTGGTCPEPVEGLARHKIAKHYLDFSDFLDQWLQSFSALSPSKGSSRSLRAPVQTPSSLLNVLVLQESSFEWLFKRRWSKT